MGERKKNKVVLTVELLLKKVATLKARARQAKLKQRNKGALIAIDEILCLLVCGCEADETCGIDIARNLVVNVQRVEEIKQQSYVQKRK